MNEIQNIGNNPELNQNIERAGLALSKLIQDKSKPNSKIILVKMKLLISEARESKISHQKITETLCEYGVKITRRELVEFCRNELGEKKSARGRKPKSNNQLKSNKPLQKRVGFRVVSDENL